MDGVMLDERGAVAVSASFDDQLSTFTGLGEVE
jgi:hypothetical protein